jgi:hypothetical protein
MQWRIVNGFIKVQDGVARWMFALVFMGPNVPLALRANTLLSNVSWEIKMSIYSSLGA